MCNNYTLPMRAANKHTSYKKVNVGVRPSVDAPDRQTRNSSHTATPPSTTTAEKYTRRTDDEDEDGDSSRRTRQKPGRGHTETRDDDPDEDTQYSLSSVALSAPELFCGCAPLPAPRPNELRSRSCGVRGTGAVAPRPRSLSLHPVWHLASMGHPRCFARVATKQWRIQGVVHGPISPNT